MLELPREPLFASRLRLEMKMVDSLPTVSLLDGLKPMPSTLKEFLRIFPIARELLVLMKDSKLPLKMPGEEPRTKTELSKMPRTSLML